MKVKAQPKPARHIVLVLEPDTVPTEAPTTFGDQVTADHLIRRDIPVATVALIMLDRPTEWAAVYPKATSTADHTIETFQHFAGKKENTASFYCDNSPELVKAARKCTWRLATATTGQPQTNGVAERSARVVKEGGGCRMFQSGHNPTAVAPSRSAILQEYCHCGRCFKLQPTTRQRTFQGRKLPHMGRSLTSCLIMT